MPVRLAPLYAPKSKNTEWNRGIEVYRLPPLSEDGGGFCFPVLKEVSELKAAAYSENILQNAEREHMVAAPAAYASFLCRMET